MNPVRPVVDDERYEQMMAEYQLSEIDRLNKVLLRFGVTDQRLRSKICAAFADTSGTALDQGWIEGEHGRHWPILAFSVRSLDKEEGLGPIEELIVPGYASSLHEYVSGSIHQYFEENNESLGSLKVGDA